MFYKFFNNKAGYTRTHTGTGVSEKQKLTNEVQVHH